MQTWASVAKSVARSSSAVAAAAMMHVMTIILIKQNASASSDPSHQSHAAASERLVSMSGFLLTIDTTYLNLSTTASLHFFQQPTIFPLRVLDTHNGVHVCPGGWCRWWWWAILSHAFQLFSSASYNQKKNCNYGSLCNCEPDHWQASTVPPPQKTRNYYRD